MRIYIGKVVELLVVQFLRDDAFRPNFVVRERGGRGERLMN